MCLEENYIKYDNSHLEKNDFKSKYLCLEENDIKYDNSHLEENYIK